MSMSEPTICSLPKPTGPVALTTELAVGPAPKTHDDFKGLYEAGFRSIINNRPDSDTGLTVTAVEGAAACAAAGLAHVHIPVEGQNPLEKDVRAFHKALETLPKPVFAYCASGGRSASLWAMTAVTQLDTATIIEKCRDIGFDVSGLKTKLDMRRELLADEDDED
jgi:sulfide:quinone oxidoreductase